jgi:hypothetical protein
MALDTGDEVEFVEDAEGYRLQKRVRRSPFSKWKGFLTDLGSEDSDEIVEKMRGR